MHHVVTIHLVILMPNSADQSVVLKKKLLYRTVTITMVMVTLLIMLPNQITTLPMALKIQRAKYHRAEKRQDMVTLFMANTGRYIINLYIETELHSNEHLV